jgi:hypothetical protein
MTDPSNDALVTIPFVVDSDHYSVIVILQNHNLTRIAAYDPAEVPMSAVSRSPIVDGRRLRDVIITYATDEEAHEVQRLARQGDFFEALRLVTRGYRFQPDRGDGEGIWRLDKED